MFFGAGFAISTFFGIDKRAFIWYIAHMNTLLLDSLTAAKVEESLPPERSLEAIARFFDAVSDVTRLKIVSALSVSSMCVSDLSYLTALNQTTVSHQLRILRDANVVEARRQGKVIFYALSSSVPVVMNVAVRAVMSAD